MYYLWIYLSKKNCEIFVNTDEGEVGWCGQSMRKDICIQDYSRTCSCEHFKPTWALSHTFRYNTHKAVLFSLHFSEQVHRNLWAAMPVSCSQDHGVNAVLSPTQCSFKPGSKSWTAQVNFCLHSPRLENTQVTFSYSFTWNTRGTQQTTQQRATPTYLLPAQKIKWGLEWGTKGIHAPLIHKTSFLTTALTPLGSDRFMISSKFLDCMWMFIYVDQCVKISSRNSPFSPHSHRLAARSQ